MSLLQQGIRTWFREFRESVCIVVSVTFKVCPDAVGGVGVYESFGCPDERMLRACLSVSWEGGRGVSLASDFLSFLMCHL